VCRAVLCALRAQTPANLYWNRYALIALGYLPPYSAETASVYDR
jgi:hypothetical protein